jgi:hypothetical protein
MATNNFNSDPTNDSFEPLMSYFDSQGVNRLESANISSYGFDGFIPTVIENRTASGIIPGMSISLTGSSTGQNFYKVLSNNIGDREFTASPSNEIAIEYLDNDQLVQVLSASVNDIFSVSYENWDGKDLGTTGWYLGNSGNAIFANVAVRGRIEATSGKVEELIIGGNQYPILQLQGFENPSASVTPDPGQLIIYTGLSNSIKFLYPGDIVKVSNLSASGWAYQGGTPYSASFLFSLFDKIKVLSASINHYENLSFYNKYHCQLIQDTAMINDYNLGQVTAKSGSYTFGDMFFGEYKPLYTLTPYDLIEGFVFDQVGQGGTWDDYIPDYLDVSGRFRLGGGNLIFDGQNLFVSGGINATSGSFSGWIKSSSVTGGIIRSGSFVGGILQTPLYIGVTNGSAFSTKGMHINLIEGAITSNQFRIDTLGNATFSGNLSAAGGTFAGNLSAAGGTFAGSLSSGISISAPVISGGTISAANIVGGTGNFTGDIQVTSINSNNSGSVYLTKNSIVTGGANFPAIDLRYNYLGSFIGRANIGFGLSGSQPAFKLSTESSVPMQIYPSGDLYIATTFGSVYVTDDVSITGTVSGTNNLVVTNGDYANPSWLLSLDGSKVYGNLSVTSVTGQNGVEMRQVVVSTNSPSSPGSYRAGTLWAVI